MRSNFSGPHQRLMPVGRAAFLDYFPILPPADDPGRLYRSFRWGRLLEMFILDTRQYRSRNAELDGPGKTMLGAAQKRWLVERVSASTATWKVVVTSVPLSVPSRLGSADSWSGASVFGLPLPSATGFAAERDAILSALRQGGVKNLVFLTAEAHHAELMRHQITSGWAVHELMAGPLSAALGRPRPLDVTLNPRSLFALGGVETFGQVSIDATGFTVRIVDIAGQIRFSYTIGSQEADDKGQSPSRASATAR